MASTLIVFSNQRWDTACQPLQHLLSRLAGQHPVVVVEQPRYHPGRSFMETHSPLPDVRVCRPHTPVHMPGFHDGQLAHLRKLVRELAREHPEHMAWFCTPLAMPLLRELEPQLVVADYSDGLGVPRRLQRQLRQRERLLQSTADLVLTSGPSQQREHGFRHRHVHCLPAGVDVHHFHAALDRTNSHPLHRDIPGPRLGYHGVIDERIDLNLIRDLADAHPRWQIVLTGPVIGISAAALPRRANIHYLGPQPYADLPRFLAGWDVCLLPYARPAAKRGINHTAALEYMAAELPIVSTPVFDVVECYEEVVTIADDAQSFVSACERALLASPGERAELVANMRRVTARASCWDACAADVAGLLRAARLRRQAIVVPEAGAGLPQPLPAPVAASAGTSVAA